MSVLGTSYRFLGVLAVLAGGGLTGVFYAEGHAGAAIGMAIIGGAVGCVFWRVGGVINRGVQT